MKVIDAVTGIEMLFNTNPKTVSALNGCGFLKKLKKGEHLFFDKDRISHVFFLVQGCVSLYKLSAGHEKKVIFIYGKGAMLNEVILDDKLASINCEALTDIVFLCFDKRQFLAICEKDFKLSKAVMDSMTLKIRRLYHQMKNTTNTLRGDKRIAAKLWKLSRDHGTPCSLGTRIDFDLTVTFLAELVGSKRETVSRQLKLLSERDLVIVDKTGFIIPCRDKLLKYFYHA